MATDKSILQLPLDVLTNIFKNLSLSDLGNVMLTCHMLRNIILDDNSLWRYFCRRLLTLHSVTENGSPRYSGYNQCRISRNWCKGIYKDKVVLSHRTNYMPWLSAQDGVLVLTVGSELRCYPVNKEGIPLCTQSKWKLEVPKILRYDVRTNDISRFKIKGNQMACGNRDGCVAVYNFDKIIDKPTLVCHIQDCHYDGDVEVTAVEIIMIKTELSSVVTASNSNDSLKFWQGNCALNKEGSGSNDLDKMRCSREITLPHCIGARCLALNLDQSKLAIGLNGNSKPILLDVQTGSLLNSNDNNNNYKPAVRDLLWHNEHIVTYVTHSGNLQSVDSRNYEVVYSAVDPFLSTLYCVKTDGQRAIVVGSSEYSRCVLFDSRKSSDHIQMYFTQKKSSPIYSLEFDTRNLIAAADRSVAVLDFNVATYLSNRRDYSDTFERIL